MKMKWAYNELWSAHLWTLCTNEVGL